MENQDLVINELLTWSGKKTSNGKSFDDLFKVEGISLGWFFKKLFLPGVIPKKLDVYQILEKQKQQMKEISGPNLVQQVQLKLTAKALRKAMVFNEKKKFKKASSLSTKISTPNKKKKVLFFTFSNFISSDGRNFRIQEVIEELKKEKKFGEMILYTAPLSARFSTELASLPTIYQYYDSEIAAKAQNLASSLYAQWKELDPKIKKEFIRLEEKSLWPFVQYLFDFYLSEEFLFLFAAYFEIAKKVLEQENIAVVVLTSPNSIFERCFVAAAKLHSIPCIVIQHGAGLSRLIDFSCPVHYAVFGEQTKQKVIAAGAPPDYVHVTGPVVFDQAYKYKNQVQKDSDLIFVVTGPYVEDSNLSKEIYFERMNEIIQKIGSIPDHKIIIKLHPREKHLAEYEKIVKAHHLQNVTFFDNRAPREKFYEAIAECRSFVSFGSTASIEAMIINKPIVTINPTDDPKIVSLMEDATINVTYQENIVAAIERSFLDEEHFRKKRESYLRNNCGRIDGQASKRIIKLALSLTNH